MREHEELEEVWRPIQGFPRYEISSKGRIKSYTSSLYPEGKILKTYKKEDGYITVLLVSGDDRASGNRKCTQHLHRLVAEAFIPIPEELKDIPMKKLHVDHIIPVSMGGEIINEDGTYNLRWVTPKGNANNPYTVENQKNAKRHTMKKVFQYDENLNLIATYPSTADCARELNKSQGNIASCCDGALKRYLGYIFSYEELTDMEQRERLEKEMEYQRKRNYENTIEAGKRYYYRNIEKMRERCNIASKKYYKANTEKVKARMKKYYNENIDRIRELGKRYREANREELNRKRREYYQKNKEKFREQYKRRKEQKNGN